ncbi:MAG: ComF family protein [Chthoniobacteraceae bacterium]
MLGALRSTGEALLSLFYPPHCAACGCDTSAGLHLCAKCGDGARRIESPFCRQCSQPFEGDITGTFTCSNCGDRSFHFDCAVAPFLARGVVREFIHRFKYEREYHLRHPLAEWAAAGLDDERIRARAIDALVPVPLHPARKREREFNQAEAIATLLARRAGVPMRDALQRTRYTTTQTRLDRHERMENLRGAFRVRHAAAVQNRHLILVDDVFTTGSTVEECARVLREAGAASVRAITVARG